MEYFTLILSLALGISFLLSGLAKLSDLQTSVNVARMIGILPTSLLSLIGYSLPFIEVIIGTMLIIGLKIKIVSIVTIFLLISFIVVHGNAINKNIDLACNCFGKLLKTKLGKGGLFHNILLLVLCFPILFFSNTSLVEMWREYNAIEILNLIVLPALGLTIAGLLSHMTDIQ